MLAIIHFSNLTKDNSRITIPTIKTNIVPIVVVVVVVVVIVVIVAVVVIVIVVSRGGGGGGFAQWNPCFYACSAEM